MQTIYAKPNREHRLPIQGGPSVSTAEPAAATGQAAQESPLWDGLNPSGHGTSRNQKLLEALLHSKIYREYEAAFNEATGLPLALRSVESWRLPHHGKAKENRFCALMTRQSASCASCLRVLQKLSEEATHEPQTAICPMGLCDMAVPVRTGDQVIGFLQTGQVFPKKPARAQFERAAQLASEWGLKVDLGEFRESYFGTRVLSSKQRESILKLLNIFAEHLSALSNQIVTQTEHAEPAVISRAKEYIKAHQHEELSLSQVAKAVHASSFYFCKLFKKYTGLNYTEYVSRVRIEKARNLLLNRNLRISEIAFEAGFQSLTHFNRVFKRVLGRSPTEYRAQLPSAW